MFSTDDTIVAIATPPGRGALGVVRLSGPLSRDIIGRLIAPKTLDAPRYATLATIAHGDGSRSIDQVIVTRFQAPHSYTGEDVVEISAHGSPVVLAGIVRAAIDAGARLAEPGEFTFRAFLNGRIDLVQAEAVADLIDAVTPLQARAAFDQLQGTLTDAIGALDRELFDLAARLEASIDFPDEGFHFIDSSETRSALERVSTSIDRLLQRSTQGRLIREGLQVAIVGKPNVGKSTLFNRLVGVDRTIVSGVPGTTRDAITEQANIGGLRLLLVDTAGIRDTADEIESEGVRRARRTTTVADLSLVVLDRSRPLDEMDDSVMALVPRERRVIIVNKIDLPAAWVTDRFRDECPVETMLVGETSVSAVHDAIQRRLDAREWTDDPPAVTNVRHASLLVRARESVARACDTLATGAASEEVILFEIAEARAALEEVSGKRTADDVLRHIFERFCVGK